MRQITQRIEHLSSAKRALLELRLRQKAQMIAIAQPVLPRAERHFAPLAFNQESLWFLEQLNPQTSIYNLSDARRLTGTLEVAALQQSLDAMVERHEALRTAFGDCEGEPHQIISAPQPIKLNWHDLSHHAETERENLAQRLLREETERPFDLSHGQLIRITLIKLKPQQHILLVMMHHIISDGWSLGIFWQELAQHYESFCQLINFSLPELPIQFADYAVWQRQNLLGEAFNQHLEYWQQQLADAPALLELPTDRPRPAVQTFRGAQQTVSLPRELHNELLALSRCEGVTPFILLLTAFKALLVHYTGQDDIVVGSPLAGRTQTETENLIGFFVNPLVLRTNLSGNPTFREMLRRVRDTALGAFAHQDVPFEKLVAELRPERSLSYNPIFQTAFALHNQTTPALQMAGLSLSPIKLGAVTAKFDLYVSLRETPDEWSVTIEYNTDLFDHATIERMLGHYQNLLTGVISDQTLHLSELPLLTDAEQHQLLVEWNDTAIDYPQDLCLHQLFEARVVSSPDAIAVIADEVSITYREINRRANQVAHYLRAEGIAPDSLVGIYTDRSLLMVIGILGILKAGGAYLPLDQSYPPARLAFMLEDAQTPIILTQQKLLANLPATAAKVVALDTNWEIISRHKEDNPGNVTQPDNLAYVIYTSGSTGQPKGTAIPHRAVNRLVFKTNYVQLEATDCIAQVSNISFDAATFELWGALLHGVRLVLINKDIALSPGNFAEQIRTHQVTTMFLTTALFNLLSREAPTAFSTLKTLMFGGEACDPNCVRDVLRKGPPQRLLHVYGPTESTTFASWHLIETVPEGATTIPIGRPISNTTIYLLDRDRNPVPVGVHGEIYIGGDGLAREYLHQPELTEEKFIVSSFEFRVSRPGANNNDLQPETQNPKPETRLYRTGDIARYLPDGSIEFIGRKDQQIKLRGFRIELGEIETALLAHPAIQDAVVVMTEGTENNKRLLAWYVATEDAAVSVSELRDFLKQRLPDYMLPAIFFSLDELPLTPNGKVDRHKLPAPEAARGEQKREVGAPQDELELRLTWIWEKVLGVPAIGVNDNFFDLGGHSLIAVRLFTEIEKVCGKRLPLATLFQAPTIAQLADKLRQQGWQPAWNSLVALRPSGARPPFFCVHAVGGNVLEYQALARYLAPEQPFYGLQSIGLDGQQSPLTSITAMAAHYIKEMRQLQPAGPYYLGGRSFGGAVAFEMARQLQSQGEPVALLAMLDTYPLGWLKLLEPALAANYKRAFQRQAIKRHLANLRTLSLKGKVNYFLVKANYKKRKYLHFIWKFQQRFQAGSTRSLSAKLRDIEELNYLASKNYIPQIYPGQVTFFCAGEEISAAESQLGWKLLSAGNVEVVDIPGDHQSMIKEPHVIALAGKLQAALNVAQEAHKSQVEGHHNG